MTLRLYNTLTRRKEEFKPLDPANVRMYVCGPTVYDFAHIGNARPVIVFDVLFRLLRHLYGESHVTYVRNITDVDDKINARALRDHPGLPLNDAIRKVTQTTADQFAADVKALGCLPPTHEPRATEHIPGMVEMISTLITKGHAYEAGGEVLFSVTSMPDYGQLSHRKLEEQQAGARVAVDAHKKNPADFVLWKLSSPEEPGWKSPWGRGRPGWHIECSEMSRKYLGEVFDIHGGGLDLIFPHHENEIAQSRCAHGTKVMANIWMHNGFLQVEGQKMSKSLGNFYTIHELLETERFGGRKWSGEVLRLAMLMTDYKEPIDFTLKRLSEANVKIETWNAIVGDLPLGAFFEKPSQEMIEILCADLNTADAIGFLSRQENTARASSTHAAQFASDMFLLGIVPLPELASRESLEAVLTRSKEGLRQMSKVFEGIHDVLSRANEKMASWPKLLTEIPTKSLLLLQRESDESRVRILLTARLEARKAKNWAESDRIRDELAAMGVTIKDNKDGTTSWEVKS